ncbi:MAG: alanine--tRNA ligase [Myxococcaceae bacterium]
MSSGRPSTSAEVRETFLSFFETQGHQRVQSSGLVPANDPTLLFTNAGMVQFKDVFTGREQREKRRATTSQKCVRAGGKHNDLDNVGFTARHHTFFEMLGNFSFGDYFKADAIKWAWELVTKGFGLPKERLAATVFKGEDGIPADEEAAELWTKAGVPLVGRLGKKDNFWSMGDTGACGPCSEIYVWLPERAPKPDELPGISDDWLEIWNLVFMQFERKADGSLVNLPKPSIDTGAGLERVTAVINGKKSNYDTDLFAPLLQQIAELTGKKYTGSFESSDDGSMRVVADHSRAAAFLIADGVTPSNEGRGYVLRRIMRRAIRHGDRLGLKSAFFDKTVEHVIKQMGGFYPELVEKKTFVLEATRHEEESFRRTLDKGLKMIDDEVAKQKAAKSSVIPGDAVFFLHDTHGFPWDLTEVIAKERGFSIDLDGYHKRMAKQREQGNFDSGEKAVGDVYLSLASKIPATNFLGYEGEGLTGSGTVLTLVKGGAEVQSAKAGDELEVVLDQTPFYGESGGQQGDTGVLKGSGVELQVLDAQKPVPSLIVHKVKVKSGTLSVGSKLDEQVDRDRRNRIRANHSATHLLHRALRVVLGNQVEQRGSVVAPDYLRFDYSCFSAPTPEQLEKVEDLVNSWIRDNAESTKKVMPIAEAKAAGAIALFGEKYGDKVRVVTVHPESTELCGGTHVFRSGDIGLFKITSESAIASGTRRVVALTGVGAFQHFREVEHQLLEASAMFKSPPKELPKRIETAQKRIKELEKKIEDVQLKAQSGSGKASESVREVNGIKVLTQLVDGADANVLRGLVDRYRDQLQSGVVGLGTSTADGKALIVVGATKDLVAKGFKSGDAVREMSAVVGGKGGGKPDFAQAGGPDPSKLNAALERLYELVKV